MTHKYFYGCRLILLSVLRVAGYIAFSLYFLQAIYTSSMISDIVSGYDLLSHIWLSFDISQLDAELDDSISGN